MLLGIDEIAKNLPSVLFVTTTNFIEAVDEAFLSRADLVMRFALPDRDTIARILETRASASSPCSGRRCCRWRRTPRGSRSWRRCARDGTAGASASSMLAALAQRLEVRARSVERCRGTICLAAASKKGGVEWAGGRGAHLARDVPDVPKELMHDHDHGHGVHDHHHGHDHDHGLRHTHTHQKDEV